MASCWSASGTRIIGVDRYPACSPTLRTRQITRLRKYNARQQRNRLRNGAQTTAVWAPGLCLIRLVGPCPARRAPVPVALVHAQTLFDFQAQHFDHGLADWIDGFDARQDGLAGLPQGKQQASLPLMQQQLACQVIGLGMMAVLPQLIYQGLGSLCWIRCHGPQGGGLDCPGQSTSLREIDARRRALEICDNLTADPTLTVPEHIAGVADGRIVVISVCYAQATARPSEKP